MSAYKEGLVIFVDVLGTKNNIDFSEKLKIHKKWHGNAKTTQMNGQNTGIFNRTLDRYIFSFSDCAYYIYIYNNTISQERKDSGMALFEAQESFVRSLQCINMEGYLIRGGATIGEVYIDDDGFFGPAIEEAFTLETRDNKYPCIKCSEELGNALNKPQIEGTQPVVYREGKTHYFNNFHTLSYWNTQNDKSWDEYFSIMLSHCKKQIAQAKSINDQQLHDSIIGKWNWFKNELLQENKKMAAYRKAVFGLPFGELSYLSNFMFTKPQT